MTRPLSAFAAAVAIAASLVTSPGASAQPDDRHREAFGPHMRFDDRYHHDHYYPPRGEAVTVLPGGARSVGFRGGNWFFHGGVWFRPVGGRFVVDLPPVGIVTPVLPPDYATLSIGGAPYYYANGIYYAQGPGSGYVVVDPPPGADVAQPMPPSPQPTYSPPPPSTYPPSTAYPPATYATPPAPVPSTSPAASPPKPAATTSSEPIYYPRDGQSVVKTEADRQACNRWATTQPGALADASVFQRATAACMEGRGYTVR